MPTFRERFMDLKNGMIPCRLLLDEGINPNELAPEDLKALLKAKAYESLIRGREIFWHRGREYIIGQEISLEAARIICLAQWIDHNDRLWFAHALFEKLLKGKLYPNLGAYAKAIIEENDYANP